MPEYLSLCLGLERVAPTQYRNYNFNSMTKFGDVYLGANSSGLFALDSGDLDATDDIEAFFELVTSDWGVPNQKRIRKMHISYETNGDLMLTVKDDDGNQRNYMIDPIHLANKQHTVEVPIGRDGKGAYWMIRIDNVNGSDFSIDRIQVVPVVLGGKPSGT
jgi:hypothetical protein